MNVINSLDIQKYILDKENYERVKSANSIPMISINDIEKKSYDYIYNNTKDGILKEVHDKTILGRDVISDLEVVINYNNSHENTIGCVLNSLNLKGSIHCFKEVLTNPVYNVDILKNRSKVITKFQQQHTSQKDELFKRLADLESDLIWMFERNTYELQALYEMVYFNKWFLKALNTKPSVLTAVNLYNIAISPVLGILTPLTYFIIPYIIIRTKLGLKVSFVSYVSLSLKMLFSSMSMIGDFKWISILFTVMFYFHGLMSTCELSKASYKVTSLICTKMNNMMEYIQIAKGLNDTEWVDSDVESFFNILNCQIKSETEVSYFQNEVIKPFAIYTNFGKQLRTFKEFKTDNYLPLYKRTYILDTLNTIGKLKTKFNLNTPVYLSSDKPHLLFKDVHHPCLHSKNPVSNNISFDKANNILLTGPNAGGKSTIIKSVLSNILLAQTFGITFSKICEISPFKYITSQINIPDTKGKESLFEAEMFRAKDNLTMLEKEDGLSFIAMDEIFNSTNPIEGISGAYAIAKKMSTYKKNLSIISTHYVYLTKLAKESPSSFVNYCMNVRYDENGEITYPYKLKRGVSTQYIALELLKRNGFESSIIDEAIRIKNTLLLKPKDKDKEESADKKEN